LRVEESPGKKNAVITVEAHLCKIESRNIGYAQIDARLVHVPKILILALNVI